MPKKKSDEKQSSVIRSRVLSGESDGGPTGTTVITSPLLSGAGGADEATARKPSRASAKRARGAKVGKKAKKTMSDAETSAATSTT